MDDFYFTYGFGIHDIMFNLIFLIIIFVLLRSLFINFKEYSYNNKQPVLDVKCKVVSKRLEVNRHNHTNNNSNHTSTSTIYFITFEFASKDRMEFKVNKKDYGFIVEHDIGILKFQGSRFLGFDRQL